MPEPRVATLISPSEIAARIREMGALIAGVGLSTLPYNLDVIANNLANVNTTGFKARRANFEEMLAQTVKQSTGPEGGRSGTNPSQVGIGVRVPRHIPPLGLPLVFHDLGHPHPLHPASEFAMKHALERLFRFGTLEDDIFSSVRAAL